MHADQSIAVLEAGKHLSCQKPMATSMADADRVAAAAERASTQYRITENFLSYPPLVKAKELMERRSHRRPDARADAHHLGQSRHPRELPHRGRRLRLAPGRQRQPRRPALRRRLAQVRDRHVAHGRRRPDHQHGHQDRRLHDRRPLRGDMEVRERRPGRLRVHPRPRHGASGPATTQTTSSSRYRERRAPSGSPGAPARCSTCRPSCS